jgi:hypothetical protein
MPFVGKSEKEMRKLLLLNHPLLRFTRPELSMKVRGTILQTRNEVL